MEKRLILLDAGGVLVTNHLPKIFAEAGTRTGTSKKAYLELYYERLRMPLWSGAEDETFFWEAVLPGEPARWDGILRESLRLLPGALNALSAVSTHGPVWLLSNHLSSWLRGVLREGGAEKYLGRLFISSETGHLKPSPQSYTQVLEAWTGPAESILFVDDQEANLRTALEMGMRTFRADPQDTSSWREAALGFLAP